MLKTGALAEQKSHIWEREEHDHFVEPHWCAERLFDVEQFSGEIWDPCCGFGRIPEAALGAGHKRILASDIVDRGYKRSYRADFLKSAVKTENIVCNPPFDAFEEFANHALKFASNKVAMIWLVRRLNAARWLDDTPLARVWLMTPRPSMPPGHVIARGEKPGGGKQDFCWLVFDQTYAGQPELRWLRRDTFESVGSVASRVVQNLKGPPAPDERTR